MQRVGIDTLNLQEANGLLEALGGGEPKRLSREPSTRTATVRHVREGG